MKAWVLEEVGKFNICDIGKPEPGQGNVTIKVMAAGICGSDIQRVYDNGAHKMPLVIGHEFSGVVDSAGDGVSRGWIGKKVGIFPLIPCRKCEACREKHYEMCSDYNYLGSRTDGGFAEYVTVPEWNLIELPEEVSFEQAAMMEPMAVAVHAIRRVKIDSDMSAAVCGLGTIGRLIIMFLRERGVSNIYEIDKGDEAPEVDVFFECVGKCETIELAINSTRRGGQICMVGNPRSDIQLAKDSYWKILRRQLRVTGTWNSTFLGLSDEEAVDDDWNYVLDALREGRVHPEELITHRFRMSDLEQGFRIMRDKTERYTKIMMVE